MGAGLVGYGGSNIATYNMSGIGTVTEPEQFGARAIRELVSLIPEIIAGQKRESPADIAEAMKIAKEDGDTELYDSLRGKLLGKKTEKVAGIVEAVGEPAVEVVEAKSESAHAHDHAHECEEGSSEAAQ